MTGMDPSWANSLFAGVSSLFRGRRMAIELGCGDGTGILSLAGSFDRVRGVDASSANVDRLREAITVGGIGNAEALLLSDPWDEPTGVADYVYSVALFPTIQDRIELANYLQRIAMVLQRGGIAQFRFDTRPRTVQYRLGEHAPNVIAGRGGRSWRRR